MSIKGFLFDGDSTPQKIDYNFLENAPCYSEYGPMTDILETKEYEFARDGDESSIFELETETLPPIIEKVPYNFIFDNIEEQIEFSFYEGEFWAGNLHIADEDLEDTGEPYFIAVYGDTESSSCYITVMAMKPAGTYKLGLSYTTTNVPLILDGTYTFGKMGE
jgi:hypothetical protein